MVKRVLAVFLASVSLSLGNIDDVLNNVVLGSYNNPARVIKSPHYNTYAGFSFGFRLNTSLLNKPVLSFQLPRITMSCAGLDFDAGWLSMMNLDTLSQLLQQAGASFMWGVAIGLIYSLPGVAEAYDMLQKWGRYSQFLGQGACQAGILAGKTLGMAIRESLKSESAENSIASGAKSTFTEALKAFKENFDKTKAFGVFPYEVYYSSFKDKDIADLIASFTGVLMFYPADNNGNVCTKKECIENIRVKYLPPLSDLTLKELINGGAGKVEVYDCTWSLLDVDGVSVMFCTNASEGGLPTRQVNITKGLADLEYKYLNNITAKLKAGTSLEQSEVQYLSSTPIENLVRLLNYAIMLEKMGKTEEKENLLQNIAYLSAALKIRSLLTSIKFNIGVYSGTYFSSKNVPSDLSQYVRFLNKNIEEAEKIINERLAFIRNTNETIEKMDKTAKYLTTLFVKEFGLGSALFKK